MKKWIARAAIATGLAMAVGCAAILGIDDGIPRDGGVPPDASLDAPSDVKPADAPSDVADAGDAGMAFCDPDAAFPPPIAFSKLDTTANDAHMRLVPPAEFVVYFQSTRDGGLGGGDIYTAQRTSIGDTWTSVAAVVGVNTTAADNDPTISADQLTLYLAHAGGISRATRASTASAFGAPVAIGAINSAGNDFAPYLVDDGTTLYFSSTRNSDAGVSELFVTQPAADGGFSVPALVNGTILGKGDNRFAAVTADQLVMYFASNRTGGLGGFDVWVATRASTSVAFGTPRNVPEISSTVDEFPDWISSDRCRLYFTSTRGAGDDNVFVATKVP